MGGKEELKPIGFGAPFSHPSSTENLSNMQTNWKGRVTKNGGGGGGWGGGGVTQVFGQARPARGRLPYPPAEAT